MDPISIPALAVWIGVHATGLFVAWITRLASGSRLETIAQFGFFTAMGVVGVTACFCCQFQLSFSVPSGITLVVMVLLAIVDFRPTHEPVGRMQH